MFIDLQIYDLDKSNNSSHLQEFCGTLVFPSQNNRRERERKQFLHPFHLHILLLIFYSMESKSDYSLRKGNEITSAQTVC